MPLNFINPRIKWAARSARNFFDLGLAGKVLGLGVLGLKYHALGLKLVVSDQSNEMNFLLHVDIEYQIFNSWQNQGIECTF